MGKIKLRYTSIILFIFKGLDSTYTELKINKTWESGLFLDFLTIFTKAACTDRAFMSFGKGNWPLSSVKEIINQGLYRSWKTWKAMELKNYILQAWKVMEN